MSVVVEPKERKTELVDAYLVEQYIRKKSEEGYSVRCRRLVTRYVCEAAKL